MHTPVKYHSNVFTIKNVAQLSESREQSSSSRLPSAPLLARRTPSPTQASAASSSRAARPATGSTNSVALPSICCRGCCQTRRPPKNRPNPRQIMTRLPPRCRTSIIQSAALVQGSFSLSTPALAPRSPEAISIKNPFRPFPRQVFDSM